MQKKFQEILKLFVFTPLVVNMYQGHGQFISLDLSELFEKEKEKDHEYEKQGEVLDGLFCGSASIPFIYENNKIFFYVGVGPLEENAQWECKIRVGQRETKIVQVTLLKNSYAQEKLKVDSKKIKLTKKNRSRVERENQLLKNIYSNPIERNLISQKFCLPLNAPITSSFGTQRVFNEVKKSAHFGIDFRAKPQTLIKASAHGKVVLGKDLFFSGKTIIIDHGLGLFTIYGHLDKIITPQNSLVVAGQIIGLSGSTGRVSGPHLHWGVKIHNVAIDGISLLHHLAGLQAKESIKNDTRDELVCSIP